MATGANQMQMAIVEIMARLKSMETTLGNRSHDMKFNFLQHFSCQIAGKLFVHGCAAKHTQAISVKLVN